MRQIIIHIEDDDIDVRDAIREVIELLDEEVASGVPIDSSTNDAGIECDKQKPTEFAVRKV